MWRWDSQFSQEGDRGSGREGPLGLLRRQKRLRFFISLSERGLAHHRNHPSASDMPERQEVSFGEPDDVENSKLEMVV